jgi:hypothetical protein
MKLSRVALGVVLALVAFAVGSSLTVAASAGEAQLPPQLRRFIRKAPVFLRANAKDTVARFPVIQVFDITDRNNPENVLSLRTQVVIPGTKPVALFRGIVGHRYRIQFEDPIAGTSRKKGFTVGPRGRTLTLPQAAETSFQTQMDALSKANGDLLVQQAALKADKDALDNAYRALSAAKAAKEAEFVATIDSLNAAIASLSGKEQLDSAQILALQAQLVLLQAKITSLTNDIAAQDAFMASLQSQIDGLESQNANLVNQLVDLQHRYLMLQTAPALGTVTGRGPIVGVGYTGSWNPREVDPYDAPVFARIYNDSYYQTRVGEVMVLFQGDPVDATIAPFQVSLLRGLPNEFWGSSNIVTTQWREDLQGWLAVIPCSQYIDATDYTDAIIRYDSRPFHVKSGAENLVWVSVLNTWSFDGRTIYTGPDHGSGKVGVTYASDVQQ